MVPAQILFSCLYKERITLLLLMLPGFFASCTNSWVLLFFVSILRSPESVPKY